MNSLKGAEEYSKSKRSVGKTISLTHGTFDLLHIGHVRLFKEIKNITEILIVAVESDSNVKNYKGDSRPIISQEDRLEIVDSIKYVDYSFIQNSDREKEDTYINMYKELSPDYVILGSSSYLPSDVQKQWTKKANVKFKRLRANYMNTTQVINKIKLLK